MADYSLIPVDHQPDFSDASLIPVDHDPFGADGAVQQAQAQPAQTETQPEQTQPQQPPTEVGQPNADAADRSNAPPADRSSHAAPGDSYPTADAAAVAALREINPTSQLHGLESAGRIYHKWLGFGDYSYTPPVEGDVYSSDPGNSILIPLLHSLGVNAGAYHTHTRGLDPTLDENYSPKDKLDSDSEREPSFLATPRGTIYKYSPLPNQPSQGQVSVLGQTNSPFTNPSVQPPTYPTVFGPR
jgi:hypothetical protein